MKPSLETFVSFTLWARKIINHVTTWLINVQRKCYLWSRMRSFLFYPYPSRQTNSKTHLVYWDAVAFTGALFCLSYEFGLLLHFCGWSSWTIAITMKFSKEDSLWDSHCYVSAPALSASISIDLYSFMNKGQWKAPLWPPGEVPPIPFLRCDWVNPLHARTCFTHPSLHLKTPSLSQPHSITEHFLYVVTHILGPSCRCLVPLIPGVLYFIWSI